MEEQQHQQEEKKPWPKGKIVLLIVIGIVFIVGIVSLIRTTSDNAGDGEAVLYRDSFVSGYEGDFDRIAYEITYPKGEFYLHAADTGPAKLILEEQEGVLKHEVSFFNNIAAGFSSAREFWDNQQYCADCTEVLSTLKLATGTDMVAFENHEEEWTVVTRDPGFVIIKLQKPAEEARKVVKTIKIAILPTDENPIAEEKTSLKVYFLNMSAPDDGTCTATKAVTRSVPKTLAVARAALNALLAGPTEDEKTQGFVSALPEGSALNAIVIENGVAKVDFNQKTESGGGSCSMTARVAQIKNTLLQFPTVTKVEISVDGRTEDIFQP